MSVEWYSGVFSIQAVESYFENQEKETKPKPAEKQDSADILFLIQSNNF